MQHGKFAFSTQLTDCETLEQSMREAADSRLQGLPARHLPRLTRRTELRIPADG